MPTHWTKTTVGTGARVTKAAAQTITTATDTAIQFDTQRFDSGSYHSTITNNTRFTVSSTGIYLISAHIEWTAGHAGARHLFFRVNGTIGIARNAVDDSIPLFNTLATIAKLTANDYVECVVNHNRGSDTSVVKTNQRSPEFAICKIGE